MKQRLLPGDIQWKCPSGMFEGEVIKHQAPHRDLRWIRILKNNNKTQLKKKIKFITNLCEISIKL